MFFYRRIYKRKGLSLSILKLRSSVPQKIPYKESRKTSHSLGDDIYNTCDKQKTDVQKYKEYLQINKKDR